MSQATPKRFIAGAVCPRCAEMDKLVMYVNELNQQVKECVRCDFVEVMAEGFGEQQEEVTTRVNQPRVGEQPLAHEDEVQVVSILGGSPGLSRKDH